MSEFPTDRKEAASAMNAQLERFAVAARAYCAWFEAEPEGTGDAQLQRALELISELYALGLRLGSMLPERKWEEYNPDCDLEVPEVARRRFRLVSFGYYCTCTPHKNLPSSEVTLGDIADDLSDIWLEIRSGITMLDQGLGEAAAGHWRLGLRNHGGEHAVEAIRAIHIWLAHGCERDRSD